MTKAPKEDREPGPTRAASVQRYARIAGILLLLSLLAGGFGEAYVPSKLIVSYDAAATAQNLKTFESLFRMGFAGYLIEAMCDIALSLILYVLLRPVSKDIALLPRSSDSWVRRSLLPRSSFILRPLSSWEALAI